MAHLDFVSGGGPGMDQLDIIVPNGSIWIQTESKMVHFYQLYIVTQVQKVTFNPYNKTNTPLKKSVQKVV